MLIYKALQIKQIFYKISFIVNNTEFSSTYNSEIYF